MQTTTLYVELLIIGFEVAIWLGLIIASVTGVGRLSALLKQFEGYAFLVTLVAFGLAYLLGIIFDKIAHFLVGAQRSYLRRLLHGTISGAVAEEDDEDYRQIYAHIMARDRAASSTMLYARSKVRILRASVLNVIFITLATAVFLSSQGSPWWPTIPVGLIIWLIILGTYIYTQRLYRSRLERFAKYLDEVPGTT